MINKIAYNNTTFTGHLAIQAEQGKSVDDIISKIPNEEERIIFKEELDTFQKRVESETSDESNFILTLGHREWEAGNTFQAGMELHLMWLIQGVNTMILFLIFTL